MSFTFAGKQVYLATYVKERDPAFFYGGGPSIRGALIKKGVPETEIFYGIRAKGQWNPSKSIIRSATVFISKKWVDANVAAFITKSIVKEIMPGITIVKRRKNLVKYKNAPPILDMEDDEKFRNAAGEIQEIEVRGERDVDKCYFRASDVANMLELPDINTTLYSEKSSFEREYDYVTFICKGTDRISSSKEAHTRTSPILFLTYYGMLKILHVSRMPIAREFQRWAAKTLFTIKHGTVDAKKALAADVIGVKVEDIKAFLNTAAASLPTIYLFLIGRVRDLRKGLGIGPEHPDTAWVAKFGFTDDLARRTDEHNRAFGRIAGANVQLYAHSVIESSNLSKAEGQLRGFFREHECCLEHPKQKELVILDDKFLRLTVKDKYRTIGIEFEGRLKEFRFKYEKLEHVIAAQEALLREKDAHIETLVFASGMKKK